VEAVTEVGIDIADQQPEVPTTDAVEASDVVITMGCGARHVRPTPVRGRQITGKEAAEALPTHRP
jgi:protein-tyrosine-phosphatase